MLVFNDGQYDGLYLKTKNYRIKIMQMGVRDFSHTQKSKSAKNSVVDLAEVAMFFPKSMQMLLKIIARKIS